MGKVIFWILVVFAVLFLLRLYNSGQFKKKQNAKANKGTAPPSAAGESMVRCANCGIFLPRSEAQLIGGAVRCRDTACIAHE